MSDTAPPFDPATRLGEREQEVLAQLKAIEAATEPPSLDEEIGRLTRMDALQQQQMALHGRRRLEIQLARVRGAFARVTEGTFGQCAMCAQTIPAARLMHVPETPFCVPCQERLEAEGRI